MTITLIDSHAHIDTDAFDADRDQVLRRASDAGVSAVICVGAANSLAAARHTVEFAEASPGVHPTVGVHPHHASLIEESWWPELETLARRPSVVAVGESGLDYYYNTSSGEDQRAAFERFLDMARAVKKPIICHIRDAHDDAKAILAARDVASIGGVIHCFTGTPEDAADYIDMGLYISFSGIITFPGRHADPIRAAAAAAPLDRILVETDCPYLAPTPHRGKRNEPAFVVHTAEMVARQVGVDLSTLAQATVTNTKTLFGVA